MQLCRVVTLHTTLGPISIELFDEIAPKTCENFASLAESGQYNNTLFHRLVPNFLVQGGDIDGNGGFSSFGYFFDDEISPCLKHIGAGVVGSASAGSNVNGSQFYITLSPQPNLDGKFTIFGRVYSGLEVLAKINSLKVNEVFKSFTEVRVQSCDVQELPRPTRPIVYLGESGMLSAAPAAAPNVSQDAPQKSRRKQGSLLMSTIQAVYADE